MLSPTLALPTPDPRPVHSSIMTVFRPIEDYREFLDSVNASPSRPGRAQPLDFFLIHLLLESMVKPALVLSSIGGSQDEECSLFALTRPGLSRVVQVGSVTDRLREYLSDQGSNPSSVVDRLQTVDSIADVSDRFSCPIVWVSYTEEDVDLFEEKVLAIRARLPRAAIVVTGLGKLGKCRGLETLLRESSRDAGCEMGTARDWAEVLGQSTLAYLAPADHPYLGSAIQRIARLHTGNFHYLEVLRRHHQLVMEIPQPGPGSPARVERSPEEIALQNALSQHGITIPDLVNSPSLRVALRLFRLRRKCFPAGSLRFRVYGYGMRGFRKLCLRPMRWVLRRFRTVVARG